jgi:serine phosphatase RsbU (regulator of sigma subunit)
MKLAHIIYGILLLLIGGILGIFLLDESNFYEKFNKSLKVLNTNKLLHDRLSEDILKSRSSLLLNFDPIVNKVNKLNKREYELLHDEFIHQLNDSSIEQNLVLFKKESKIKKNQIEQYKITYTVLRNSVKSLPFISNDLLKSTINSHKNQINILVKEVLILNNQPDLGDIDYIKELIFDLEHNTVTFNKEQAASLDLLLRHTQIVISKTTLLNDITYKIVNTEINNYLGQIERRFNSLISQKIENGKNISKLLYGIIILLLLLVSYVINQVIQKQRRLATFSEALEKKVKSRTLTINKKNEELELQTQELRTSINKIATQTLIIQAKSEEVQAKNEEVDAKNRQVTASITYAKRIQTAMLPSPEELKNAFPNSFVLFKPKDIVSGDFYWLGQKDNKIILGALDCTGHGVSGAFMSLIGNNLLDDLIMNKNIFMPHQILDRLNLGVISFLKQQNQNSVQDGMDAGLCMFDKTTNELHFAGAHHSLYYVKDNELHEVKGNRMDIGGVRRKEIFDLHSFKADKKTCFYLFSDGYPDQFGGKEDRKYGKKRLRELLLKNHHLSFEEQYKVFDHTIEDWRQNGKIRNKQTDDILLIGFNLEGLSNV